RHRPVPRAEHHRLGLRRGRLARRAAHVGLLRVHRRAGRRRADAGDGKTLQAADRDGGPRHHRRAPGTGGSAVGGRARVMSGMCARGREGRPRRRRRARDEPCDAGPRAVARVGVESRVMSGTFREKYGPWAVVAGAAVGRGAEWARQLAGRGLDVVLLDREAAPLEATARAIREASGVETRGVVVDLARADVAEVVSAAVSGLEVGMLVYNAAIGTVSRFLEIGRPNLQAMLDVNC